MKALLLATVATLQLGLVHAQAPVAAATVKEMVERLAPSFSDGPSARDLVPERRRLELQIQFSYDSATLAPPSRTLLDNLAAALLSDRLKDLRFKVEGHTDASGSASYNERLSLRRAQTVVDYLAGQGVAPDRLIAEGKGFTELLHPDMPRDGRNRRVRIVTLF